MLSLNTGDTGFVMLCTALVCMMTPALALFYGGMVRKKNVLTIMMQNFISMGVTAIIWIFGGFSLAFGPDVGGLFGDISYHFALDKVGIAPSPVYASTVPFILFFAYQLMFAVIAPALITGAFAGRLNFRGYLKFLILWMIFIYIPVCHWIWGGGFLAKIGVMDFAGGIVIHVSAGFAALASVIFLGRRDDMNPDRTQQPAAGRRGCRPLVVRLVRLQRGRRIRRRRPGRLCLHQHDHRRFHRHDRLDALRLAL